MPLSAPPPPASQKWVDLAEKLSREKTALGLAAKTLEFQ